MILLKKIFDVGLRKGYYSSNPAKLIKKLPIEKTKMQFWTVKEFQKFLTLFEPEEYNIKLLFTVLFFTGLRLGEDYLVVKERLGHASITTTIDTYSHLYPSKQKDLADKLDDLL
ncbi:site-specific recombinase, phage integrase family [Streptococcus pneumoniae]|nr:site-specific recombinase, phage integrase family [Streptococcus pneumoniae]